ncbi:BRO family protein [Maribacter confluentis]|uniref:BRO family protein n=1 Tax=Maribacter confluentis TaxID=1656093 RepID=A0ABT8RSL1_9FLAO|nr:BRO family protein [Maribacter confluentis]MDO1513920.1 BRO family protein [Maribacter confluentis]
MLDNSLQQDELNNFQQLASVEIENQIWFIADDVTQMLAINDLVKVLEILDEDERNFTVIYRDGSLKSMNLISESGLYALILRSDTQNTLKCIKWITNHILPLLRIQGYYTTKRLEIPNFVIRFNDNWNRVDKGYFSVLSELFIRLYGRFEHEGYTLPSRALNGKEVRPDISVINYFDEYLKEKHPEKRNNYKIYKHRLPNGREIEARQFKLLASCINRYCLYGFYS